MRKIAIIHHNNREAQSLQIMLQGLPGIEMTGCFLSLQDAASFLQKKQPDVIIADVQATAALCEKKANSCLLVCMGTGEEINAQPNSDHMFAYLQWPFTQERVFSLLQHAELFLSNTLLVSSVQKHRDFIFIKSDYKLIRINLADILFLSGLRDYTQVYLKGKLSPLTTLQNLKEFEIRLPASAFIRVHRSYIISLNQVDSISRNEISIGSHIIPIGNAYRQVLDNAINKNF